MSLIKKFEDLLSHLNSEENGMAEEFKAELEEYIKSSEDDALWRNCLENGGVDNWGYYSESLHDGGYFDDEEQ